jgi:hypothetical protein
MQFRRLLRQSMIDTLNQLYENKNSWWYKIVEDKDAIILIRNNRLHVLVNGGLLLQISMGTGGNLVCKIHEEFLSLRSEKDPYIDITEKETAPPKRVEGLRGLEKHYRKVKQRIKIFAGSEKKAVQNIALRIRQIIDLEVGLEGEKKEDTTRKGAQRVDMTGITDDGVLVFFETKLFGNKEIRARQRPDVVGQLRKYEKLLEKYRQEILSGYEDQFKMYRKLKGSFFRQRIPKFETFKIYPKVRLIITGFDGSQAKFLLPVILNGIYKGMSWKEKTPDLIPVGSPSNIKENHLFQRI